MMRVDMINLSYTINMMHDIEKIGGIYIYLRSSHDEFAHD